MKISAIALDDEQPSLEILEAFCHKMEGISLEKTFIKTSEANYYLENHPIDLIFLDINMPSRSGIEFFKAIPQDIMVIFTTAYKEYAIESYEIGAIDYLLKPFSFERFKTAIERVIEKKKNALEHNNSHIYFRIDYGLSKILLKEILVIEGFDNYVKIYLDNKKTVIVRMTIKAILEKLPQQEYCRVHRSYIVPLSKINSYKNKMIDVNNEKIPVGNAYEKEFLDRLNK